MTERLFDDLARALARPIPRRTAVRIVAGAFVAASMPATARAAFRGPGAATQGRVICQAATQFCRETSCPEGSVCCYAPPDPASPSGCIQNPHCCDPCNSTCGSDGYCVSRAGGCNDDCCAKRGLGDCCGQICCAPDQICNKSRGICCPPDRDAPLCNVPASNCKKQVDEQVERDLDDCTGGFSLNSNSAADMQESGVAMMSCSYSFGVQRRDYGYRRCPQIASDALCSGGSCDKRTLRCKRCAESRTLSRTATDAAFPAVEHGPVSDVAHGAEAVTVADLRRRLRAARPRVSRAYVRAMRALRTTPRRTVPRADVASALKAYRSEVVKLRRQLAVGRGGRPQRLALKALDEQAAGLASFEAAARATTRTRLEAESRRGQALMKRATGSTRAARKALGCGKRC